MKLPILLISEFLGVVAVVMLLSISPAIRNKRPLKFLYPKREGLSAFSVGVLILVLTAVLERFQPAFFDQLMNFVTYPTLLNGSKPSFSSLTPVTAQALFSAAMIVPVALALFARRQPLLSIGLSKPNLKPGLQMGAVLVILVIFLQGKIFTIINGLNKGATIPLIIALIAALGEEVVFRGYLQPRMDAWIGARWGWLAGVFIYVVWWALPSLGLYAGNATQFFIGLVYRAALGLTLGWIMKKSGSLPAPFLYHAVHLWMAFI